MASGYGGSSAGSGTGGGATSTGAGGSSANTQYSSSPTKPQQNQAGMTNAFKLELRKRIKELKKSTGKLKFSIKDFNEGKSNITNNASPVTYSKQEKVEQEVLQQYGVISTADNEDGSQEKYTGRLNYKRVYNQHSRAVIDTWYDLPFFSRTDEYGLISSFDLVEDDLVDLNGVQMVNFIADAFKDLAIEYNARAKSPVCCRGLNKSDTMLARLFAVRSYVNELEVQDQYLENFYSQFSSEILSTLKASAKIKNIDDFYRYLKVFIKSSGMPITTPGIMESEHASIYMSGLAVDVLSESPDDDSAKIRFLEDPNFKIFQNLAFKYNFKVDINVPWRIIFDYRTKKAAEYLNKYPVYKLKYQKNLTPYASYHNFSTRYNGFAQILVKFYHRFIGENPTYNVAANYGEFSIEKQNRPFEVQALRGKIVSVNRKYVSWYAEIRNIERGMPLGHKQLNLLKKRTNNIVVRAYTGIDFAADANVAINYIEYVMGTVGSQSSGKSLISFKEDPIMLFNMMKLPKSVASNVEKQPVETKEDLSCHQAQGHKQCYFVELPDGKFYWTKDPDGEMPQQNKEQWGIK
tara:strand:+ start:2660 stop:4390 length:1731 start_codon:yes stop_codon:yes gene_type:complete